MAGPKTRPRRVRLLRNGELETPDREWLEVSISERIEAVWTLTEQCLQWQGTAPDAPRLQRTVSRIQRPQR